MRTIRLLKKNQLLVDSTSLCLYIYTFCVYVGGGGFFWFMGKCLLDFSELSLNFLYNYSITFKLNCKCN